jgi:membrane associated rhomboid family serine protease
VINLVLANAAIYVADMLFDGRISSSLALKSDLFQQPWHAWQLVTYGFVHDPKNLLHVAFNMLGLWFFGRDVEGFYGRAEFLRIYLVAVVVAGLLWAISAANRGNQELIGASGGVMCVIILFVLHFPMRRILIWGVLPVPAWALGTLYVLTDFFGVRDDDIVAHVAHLGGMGFAALYYYSGFNLGRLVPRRLKVPSFKFKPKLRIHDPEERAADLNQQVDRILEKIHREGEASLTKSERRTLEEASRRYQRRKE